MPPTDRIQPSIQSWRLATVASFMMVSLARPTALFAVGGGFGSTRSSPIPTSPNQLFTLGCLFGALFVGLALFHAAEIAITTLYPWKVREFAEEEEKRGLRGTFYILNQDITRVLTTLLVASTSLSIFATTIFTRWVGAAFGAQGERYGPLALTCLTLFFVELIPKSIGVTNAESVARMMTPPINIISRIVSPLGITLSWLAKKLLSLVGLQGNNAGDIISDSQLRLIVTGARDSGTIDRGEQEMIQGVLDLQTKRVREIMQPRVEMVAVPRDMSVASVLDVVRESGYSRIPVYDGEIDNIVGIVLAKSVLDFFVQGVLVDDTVLRVSNTTGSAAQRQVKDSHPTVKNQTSHGLNKPVLGFVQSLTGQELTDRMDTSITKAGLIESCYFVPETANGWSVLQEMRKRRVHMAIVVDEYGGTEGLVSLEDIVEEVVGEIYDEDDEEEFDFSEDSISIQDDGTFLIRGDAELEDCSAVLGLHLDEEDEMKDFATISGFLCMCAGEIPGAGDFVMYKGWCFEVLHADDKKVLEVRVERLVGVDDETREEGSSNPLHRALLKRQSKSDSPDDDSDDDEEDSNPSDTDGPDEELDR
eukprot:Nitzschia sp. Nitz4//scaffold5_size260463//219176//221023//NITZ4_001017-RA/size260463-augustus-gene-0.40-mRNA-1//-1//CDS//3329555445//4761//frame0